MKNIFKNIDAIIFDFDGTIANTLLIHETAFEDALAPHALHFNYADYLGMSTIDTIKGVFEKNGRSLDQATLNELTDRKRKLANLHYSSIEFMPGACAFIELAHQKAKELFIGSSGSAMNIKAGVAALKLADYFKGVYTASDISRSKPDPEIFENILNVHRLDKSKTLVLEDAEAGIAAADAAGISVVSVDGALQISRHYNHFIGHFNFTELSRALSNE
jgi:beta-phosphoglucomutase